jgi:hypothetical protein
MMSQHSRPLEDKDDVKKDVEYDDSISIDFGCKPDGEKRVLEYLNEGDRDEIKKLGFGTFLDLRIGNFIGEQQPIDWLVRHTFLEEGRIAIRLRDDVIFYMTPEIISLLMHLPRGDKGPLKCNPQKSTAEHANCRIELGVGSLKVENVVEVLKKTKDRKLKVKCFILLVISQILMPTTAPGINTNAVMYTKEMDTIKDFDWCTIVYEDLRTSVSSYKDKLKKLALFPLKKKPSRVIGGCVIMLLVSINSTFPIPNQAVKLCLN